MANRKWKGPVEPRNARYSAEEKEKLRGYYHANKEYYRAEANKRVAARRLRNQQWMVDYLQGKSCQSCGVSDPRVLTFNHRDPTEKYGNVADIISKGRKLEYLVAEVAKCNIECHNCHMLITFEQLGGSYHDKLKPTKDNQNEDSISNCRN